MQDKSFADLSTLSGIETSILELRRTLADLESSLTEKSKKKVLAQAQHQLNALEDRLNNQNAIRAGDTTESENKFKAYQQHESMLQAIFDHTTTGVAVVTGPEGIFRFVNDAYLRMIPHPDVHPLGKITAEVWPVDEGFTAVDWYRNIYQNGKVLHNDHVIRHFPDGSTHYFSLHVQPFCWENEKGALILAHEITALVEANQEAKESQHILDALMQYIPEGITIADAPDVKIRQVSQFGQNLTGRSAEEIEGIPMDDHPDRWQIYYQDGTLVPADKLPLSRAVLTGEVGENEELNLRRPNGDEIIILCNAGPIQDESSSITGGVIAWRDVTERQRAEAHLRQREELLQKLIDNIPVMIVMYPPDITGITVNKEFERVTGWTQEEVQHISIMEVCYPDPEYRQVVAQFMEELSGWMDIEMTIKDGSQIETIWYNFRLKDDTNIGIGLDISDRKRAQQALAESETRFRTLADNIAQLTWMTDPTGWIYWYNQRWFDYTGTTLEEMQGWGWQKVHHPGHVDRVTEKFRQHVQIGQPWEDTFPLRSKDGEYRWFLSRALPIRDEQGQVLQWFGTNTDVTDQMTVEVALRQSEERFRIALDGSPMVVFTMDCDLRYTWIYNPREGFDAQSVIGKRDQDLIDPEEAAKLTAFKREVLASGTILRGELTYKIGLNEVTYDITAEALHDEQGEVSGLIAAAIDVTDIRRMEREAFEQRTRIEVQRHLIRQREEERARIAREIHDGSVQSLSVLLFGLEEINWIDDVEERKQKIAEIGEAIQVQIREMRGLCNELRPSTLHYFGLEKAIRSHVENVAERFPEININLDLISDRNSIPADVRLEMYRIFQEALTNCVKHAEPSEITIRLFKDGSNILLQIEDDGKGFSLNPQREIYAKQGSLGMIGMQERADIIGASFSIKTEPGAGTCVTLQVKLPFVD
jgi:PAS domain S-box-containing protein